jgi:hypothetical protein
MANFGDRWEWVSDFIESGQAHTFKVRDKSRTDDKIFILKRLKNPKQGERFDLEIRTCLELDHANELNIEDYGTLPGMVSGHFL